MSMRSNLRQNIYLIGNLDTQICGNKLPSMQQVLRVLFFNIREVKLSIRESAKLVVNEVKIFWEKARLPTQQDSRCIVKVVALHQKWATLQKTAGKPSNFKKEQEFCAEIKKLFDIAHGNILETVDDIKREFLENQRRDNRIGYINNIEGIFEQMEREEERKNQIMIHRQERSQIDQNILGKISIIKMYCKYCATGNKIKTLYRSF